MLFTHRLGSLFSVRRISGPIFKSDYYEYDVRRKFLKLPHIIHFIFPRSSGQLLHDHVA